MIITLYSTGKLAEGIDEATAITSLQNITKLSAEKIKENLLNGRKQRLTSSNNREKVEKIRYLFSEAGLLVTIESSEEMDVPVSFEKDDKSEQITTVVPRVPTPLFRRLLPIISLLLIMMIAAGGYGWYWLNRSIDVDALATETALADGSMVAIAHIDVEKIVTLREQWFGDVDPQAFPLLEEEQDLLRELFSGEANFSQNLQHAFFSLHTKGEGKDVATTLLLNGQFNSEEIIKTLGRDYQVEPIASNRWSLLEKSKKVENKVVCPQPVNSKKRSGPRPNYLQITPQQMVISNSTKQIDHLNQRLNSAVAPSQDLAQWRSYRKGQLASMMVFIPTEASKAVSGFPGMIARKTAKDTPQISNIAARVGVAPLSAGLLAGVMFKSSDANWNRDSATAMRQKIEKLSQDSNKITPSLGRLLSRVSVDESEKQLQVELSLNGEMMGELGASMQEAVASLFTVTISDGSNKSDAVVERIDTMVNNYDANAEFENLPVYSAQSHNEPPLFKNGSFGVTMGSISRNKEGLFVINIKGEVALPKVDFSVRRVGTLTLYIDDLLAADGTSVMRDEHCLEGPFWERDNHKPEITKSFHSNSGMVTKRIRLKEGAIPDDIASVTGRLQFEAPIKVKRIPLSLKVGTSIEHAGLRFHLNSAKQGNSVSYQISGAKERFLELRALNTDGKPLQRDWSMGSHEKGRMTQNFHGTIHALELYIAESSVKRETPFTMRDLFVPPIKSEDEGKRHWFAPEAISSQQWQRYAKLDMSKLHTDPKDKRWHPRGNKSPVLASLVSAPITIDMRHEQKGWETQPTLEIYYPMLEEIPGVLSLISYSIEQPSGKHSGREQFSRAFYSYHTKSGKIVTKHHIDGYPFAQKSVQLQTNLKKGERLERLAGNLRFRLPIKTNTTRISLDALWQGKSVDGVSVTLDRIDRGMFPGYQLKIEGSIERLVNLHGLDTEGKRIAPDPVNLQSGGYWTMTLPFTSGIEEVELVMAAEQKIYDYPFDFQPDYPN